MKARIRIRMGSNHAHYAGGLVDGAKMLELFGDVATELCIRADGDEGLFRAYDAVEFLAPVRAGDFIEAEGTITRWGKTSLGMEFVARKVIVPTPRARRHLRVVGGRRCPSRSSSAARAAPAWCRRTCGATDVIGRPGPCIITAAIVGAETTRAQNPHLPLSADELAAEARALREGGRGGDPSARARRRGARVAGDASASAPRSARSASADRRDHPDLDGRRGRHERGRARRAARAAPAPTRRRWPRSTSAPSTSAKTCS